MTMESAGPGSHNPVLPFADPDSGLIGLAVGESKEFRDAVGEARRLVRNGAQVVLVQGESGTGRALFARGMHYVGPSPHRPFVGVHGSSLPSALIEAELFGARAGSLPGLGGSKKGIFELVGPGTVFLDEIHEFPPSTQQRLAEWMARDPGNPYGMRIIASTSLDVRSSNGGSILEEDLRMALLEHRLQLPPLRRRTGDIPLLAEHFLKRWGWKRGLPAPHLHPGALRALEVHVWPGNVRELRDTLERAAELAPGHQIRDEHLRIRSRDVRSPRGDRLSATEMILIPPEGKPWERIEEEVVEATLAITGGNRSAAARILGISRPTLTRKIRKYELA